MSHIHLIKIVLETQSPLAINTGMRETGFDSELVRDINGLPTIPATAIAGVWGHLTEQHFDEKIKEQWFGQTSEKSTSSQLIISNATLLDSQHKPSPLFTNPHTAKDPIIALCAQARPHHRERVSINDRGVAKETGKFDQILLPTGLRFEFNIQWRSEQDNISALKPLLSLFNDRQFCLGASTTNGLGRIKIVCSNLYSLDMQQGAKIGKTLQQLLRSPATHKNELDETTPDKSAVLLAKLPVKALDNWRFGSGAILFGPQPETGSVAMMSYSEPCIEWSNNTASINPQQAVLCGSAIKGMLAHRVSFHYRKLSQQWAHTLEEQSHDEWQTRPKELNELFGFAADSDNEDSLAGKLLVNDATVSHQHTVLRTHNSIDRFTGGVRQGALFSEELLYQPEFTIELWLKSDATVSPTLKQALLNTLQDIQLGLLPMGAGSGRGTSIVEANPSQPWQVFEQQLNTHPQEQTA